ncbi:hypothetical protein H8356DRAFT_1343010 [Neocallimastix lanati (nom. inval.)]|nr:hypothetical protein H8356DRAFT_1343010 [Neocallimastix sp. JGI-2020a]
MTIGFPLELMILYPHTNDYTHWRGNIAPGRYVTTLFQYFPLDSHIRYGHNGSWVLIICKLDS